MQKLKKYYNKKIAIYGMGLTGLSAVKKLEKLGAEIYCWDDVKKVREKVKKSNIRVEKFWLGRNSVDNIIISPGINIKTCKIKNYLGKNLKKIITDLDIFFELNKEPLIVAITGTNGKSTTCKIIEKIFKTAKYNVKVAGNIGTPILSINNKRKKNIIILEVSSYQLEYSKLFHSKYAAILNISADHLDRHKNISNYTKIKSKIFFGQNSSDYSFINKENKYSKSIKNIFKNKKIKSKLILVKKSNCKFILNKTKNKYFNGKGNIENLAFAYKIAKCFKISDKIIIRALNSFKGLPHRQEVILSNKDLLCINDSKATSFEACFQSLSNYNKIYWILGGVPKKQDNFYLAKVKNKIKKAYIIGKNATFFKKQIKNNISYKVSANIKSAIKSIHQDIKKNENFKSTILLSPAAASFDQFNNFEDRGNYFKKLILKEFKSGSNV